MLTFLEVAGLCIIAGVFVALLYRPIVRLVQSIFSLILSPLGTIHERLCLGIKKVSSIIADSEVSFMVYLFAFCLTVFACVASYADFLLTSFSLEVIGLEDAVIAHTKMGNITAAIVLAFFLVLCQWVFGYLDHKKKECEHPEQQQEANKRPKRKISWFKIAFIVIAIVVASLSYFRTVEIEAPDVRVPVVDVFNHSAEAIDMTSNSGLPLEAKGAIAATITILTSVAIAVVSGSVVETGVFGIFLLIMLIIIVILSILAGIIWLSNQILARLSIIVHRILALLFSFGSPLVKSVRNLRRVNKNVIVLSASIMLLSLTNSGCVLPRDTSGKTEAVIILDTSYSFKNLLKQAVKLSESIILNLPPNSELTIIKIDKSSYEQCSEIAYVKIPSRSNRETYAKAAKEVYDKATYELEKTAIDSLQKVLTLHSSYSSDIWSAIEYGKNLFSDNASKKILIIMSDFQHNTKTIEDTTCSFKGINIWGLFANHDTDSPSEYKKRISRYEEYFLWHQASSVKFLDPIRSSTVDVKEILELEGGVE